MTPGGLPHSGIRGSTPADGSPRLFAAIHALLRLVAPRHPPCALSSSAPRNAPCRANRTELDQLHTYAVVNGFEARDLASSRPVGITRTRESQPNKNRRPARANRRRTSRHLHAYSKGVPLVRRIKRIVGFPSCAPVRTQCESITNPWSLPQPVEGHQGPTCRSSPR